MKAIVQAGYGAPEQVLTLAEIEPPPVGADDVLVRVAATSVNTPDWLAVTGVPYALRGRFGLRGPRSRVRGTDVAGVVEAVGAGVTGLRAGDEVLGSLWDNAHSTHPPGTFAEFTAVPARQLIPKPPELPFADAGGGVMSGLTALAAVGDVPKGARVLINGASGGVGTFAVQIAKRRGAEVTAVCSGANAPLVRELGAHHTIDYTTTDFTQGTERYDVILDNVLNHPPKQTAHALAHGGTLIPNSVGTTGGLFGALPRMARAKFSGGRFVRCVVDKDRLTALATLLASGEIRTVIDHTYGLEETPGAVAHMLSHRARGQVVIMPR